jgi:hypothetical protein
MFSLNPPEMCIVQLGISHILMCIHYWQYQWAEDVPVYALVPVWAVIVLQYSAKFQGA